MAFKTEGWEPQEEGPKHEATESEAERRIEYGGPSKKFVTYDDLQEGAPGKAPYRG
jgi:hypothetical protein